MATDQLKSKGKMRYGGYDEYFLDTVPDRLICSICLKVLRDPHLMACCGQKYCSSCLLVWFRKMKGEVCPHCRANKQSQLVVLHILDKGMRSEVESLHTLCHYFKDGCSWKGELRQLKSHLRSECDQVLIECPNHCLTSQGTQRKVRRKNMVLHLTYCLPPDQNEEPAVHTTRSKMADLSSLFSCFSCEY